MTNRAFHFPKQERVVSQKLIDELFGGGNSHAVVAFPLRAVFMEKEQDEGQVPVQVLMSVPKRKLKHAVDRNRVKRQLREAYRLQKQQVAGSLSAGKSLVIAFVWLADKVEPSAVVAARMNNLLGRISKKLTHE